MIFVPLFSFNFLAPAATHAYRFHVLISRSFATILFFLFCTIKPNKMIRAIFGEISYFTNYLFNFKILKKPFITLFKPGHLPRHIGFIMDGNRRFAKENGILTSEGHRAGVKALADVCDFGF